MLGSYGEGDRRTRFIAVGMLAVLCAGVTPAAEKDEPPPMALENPILRSHFRDQFLTLHSFVEPYRTPSRFAQTFVDRQIRHFLEEVEEKLAVLQTSVDNLTEIRRQVTEKDLDLNSRTRSQWKDQARGISRSAGDLRQMLAVIFLQLRSKDSFKARVNPAENNIFFDVEVRHLNRDVKVAARLIRSYLFNASSTVHITDLRHTNMLILLYHIEQRARLLQRKI